MGDGIRYAMTERGLDRVMANGRTMVNDKAAGSLYYSALRRAASLPGDPPNRTTRPPWDLAYDAAADPGAKLWMLRYVKGYARAARFAELWTEAALLRNPNVLSVEIEVSRSSVDSLEILATATLPGDVFERIKLDARYAV